jgi:hypothetical protein
VGHPVYIVCIQRVVSEPVFDKYRGSAVKLVKQINFARHDVSFYVVALFCLWSCIIVWFCERRMEICWVGKQSKEEGENAILIIKRRDAIISQICVWNRTLRVSDRFSVHHQESSTVHTAIHTRYTYCCWFYYKKISRFTVL